MSLEDWQINKLTERHKPTAQEIISLLQKADSDLEISRTNDLGPDWQLTIAYNAALLCAIAALVAAGYRARTEGHHYITIQSLAYTIQAEPALIKQLDKFRKKRNVSNYERMGMVTEKEVEAVMALAKKLRNIVEEWLRVNHPDLMTRG